MIDKQNIDSVGLAVELGSPIANLGSPLQENDELHDFVEIPKMSSG